MSNHMKNRPLRMENKEIYMLRLTITTKCILKCKYCFVKKGNKIITKDTYTNAIRIFLNSPGKEKLLMLYGGEPLLYFNLLKKIISFAQKEAQKTKKRLIISVGTNGIMLNKDSLKYFNERNIKLGISLDGQKQFNDKARVFPNKKGSFDKIMEQFSMIVKNTKNENLCVLLGVLPTSVSSLYENMQFVNKLGCTSINIEPIESRKFLWNKRQKKIFLLNLFNYVRHIHEELLQNNYLFLNTVNLELKNQRLSGPAKTCPFFENLEVHPNGEMTFSAFLINSKEKKQYLIGNINKKFFDKYRYCKFSENSSKCQCCKKNYYPSEKDSSCVNSSAITYIRNLYSINFAKKLLGRSRNSYYQEYIKAARKRIFE